LLHFLEIRDQEEVQLERAERLHLEQHRRYLREQMAALEEALEEQDRQDPLKMQVLELEQQQEAVEEERYQQVHLPMEVLEEILYCKVLEEEVRQEQQMARTVEMDGLPFMMVK
jgi:hypothetical protein